MRAALAFAPVHALHQTVQLLAEPYSDVRWLLPLHVLAVPLAVRRPRLGIGLVAVLGAAQCAATFPRTATHAWLGVVVSLLFLLVGDDDDAMKRAALALPCTVIFWSGVQKVVHGYWFHGELLAWMMVSRGDVTFTLLPLLDDTARATLAPLKREVEGSGPFRLGGAWTALANAVWVSELAAPAAALVPWLRARLWAVLLAFVWALQLVAHEWQFALLLTNLLLCAAPLPVQPKARGVAVAALLALGAARVLGVDFPPELV